MNEILLFVAGIILLVKGAEWLVESAIAVAKKFKIPPIIIGLTIVALGTSLPELVVNIFASNNGSADLAIGNILGSNIANILLILGIVAVLQEITITRQTLKIEIPLGMLAAFVLWFLVNDPLTTSASTATLGFFDGIILLFLFGVFIYYTISLTKTIPWKPPEDKVKSRPDYIIALMLLAGLGALNIGGEMVVKNAVVLAQSIGVSEALIGLTIVAIGTSLPELVTSVVAALKKSPDIAVGNIVGSNIFNILFILGISSILNPLPFNQSANIDIAMVIASTCLLLGLVLVDKKYVLEKKHGIAFLLIYAAYMVFVIMRG